MGTPRKSTQALAGVLSALAALGVGHAVAAAMSRPAASPLIAVGSVAVDAAPTPVKEIAVRLLGNWDKPVLISGIGIVLLVAAAGIGLLAWRRPRTALVAIGALGLVGSGAALLRAGLASGGVWSAVPSIVAGAVGVASLALITRASQPPTAAADPTDSPTISDGSRRRFIATLAGVGVLAAVGAGVGEAVNRTRLAARELIRLPRPRSAAPPVPDGVQVAGVQTFTTPNDEFYRVDITLVTPRVDVGSWKLTIDGGGRHARWSSATTICWSCR